MTDGNGLGSSLTGIGRREFIKKAALGAAAVGLAAAGAGTVLSGCGPTILKKEKPVLNVTHWGGDFTTYVREFIADPFEKEHDCIVTIDNAFPWLPKLIASPKDAPVYDVVEDNTSTALKAMGLGVYVDPGSYAAHCPNLKGAWDFAHPEKNGIAPIGMYNLIGLGYRTDKVPRPPTAWKDMWDEAYADKRGGLVITNGIMQMFLMMASKIFGSDYNDIDAGIEAMTQLKPMKTVEYGMDMNQLLERGEIWIGVFTDGDPYRLEESGLPCTFTACDEGNPYIDQLFCVTSGSKKKELAYEYVNWWMDPKRTAPFLEKFWSRGPHREWVVPDKMKPLGVNNSPEEIEKLADLPYAWWNEHEEDIILKYNKAMM